MESVNESYVFLQQIKDHLNNKSRSKLKRLLIISVILKAEYAFNIFL